MNRKRLISVILAVLMILSAMPAGITVRAGTVPTEWAIPEMNDANTSGLLTPNAARDFHRPLTRDEFCELVVEMAERTLGYELPIPKTNPFSDSDSVYVQKASQYGIVNGVGGGKFAPNDTVERQQLVTMMIRAIESLGTDTGKSYLQPGVSTLPFSDSSKIASYAANAVKIAYANGIMKGDNLNNFNPASAVTSQECVAVIIRSFNNMQDVLSTGKTPQQLVDMDYNRLHIGFAYGDTADGVTRTVVLPTQGANGTTITWQSSNTNVIDVTGAVTVGTTVATVKLTATIALSGATRNKEFTLKTSPYSGDRLLVENAYSAVDIIYTNEGDSADSVTGRICLPTNVLGVPVTWSSNNSYVVTNAGYVTVPSGNDLQNVTLTATVSKGTQYRSKTFNLRVMNPLYTNRKVSLHGVELDMTATQVSTVLGSPKRTIQLSGTESWSLYHNNYANFVAVAFVGNRSVAVYSMAGDAANQLKDATRTVVTVEQVNGVNGVGALTYTEGAASSARLAVKIYDLNSSIHGHRTLYADGQEQLLFELMNAYRARSSRTALEWNAKLAASARTHSTEMGYYNYLNVTSRTGSSIQDRAAAQGYERTLVSAGNVFGGEGDSFDFLYNMLGVTSMRNDILSAAATTVGTGFSVGNSGQYKTYLTYVMGSLRTVTAITTTPASITVSSGGSLNVTLNLTPSNSNEAISWSSSNTNVMTLSGTAGAKTLTVKGVSGGTANIIVTCASSGRVFYLPVTVGTTYASALSVKYGSTTLKTTDTLFMGTSDTLQLTAVTTPASGPYVTWSSNNPNIATVSSTGLVTAKANPPGTVVITASVQKSATENITVSIPIFVASLTFSPSGEQRASLDQQQNPFYVQATVTPADINSVFTYTASSSIPAIATVAQSGQISAITCKTAGTTVITVVASRSGSIGSISRSFNMVVTEAEFANSLSLPESNLILEIGSTKTLQPVTITPSAVVNNKVEWSSNNPAVASVDKNTGLITAIKEGVAVITAALPKYGGGSVTDEVIVTVTKKPILPTAVTILGSVNTFVLDSDPTNNTLQLDKIVNPADATDVSVTWSSSDPTIAQVNQLTGLVTFVGAGPVTITVACNANPIIARSTCTILVTS